MDIIITGGTGMVGSALTPALLQAGHTVCILTRDQHESKIQGLRYQQWNIHDKTIDPDTIAKADAIIHLAGANVGEKRWTSKRKQEILQSRVRSGELISRSLQTLSHHIHTVISTSGIGWYGPLRAERVQNGFVETDPSSPDFLGEVCRQWEGALDGVKSINTRLVIYRFGLILSNKGGVYPAFLKPIRFGFAPIPGNGKQLMSWIHIEDAVRMILLALENKNISGVYNGAAPGVVSSEEMIRTIGKASGKRHLTLYVPAPLLKLGLGEMSVELLKSARVSSEKIRAAGFEFLFPTIEEAVCELVSSE